MKKKMPIRTAPFAHQDSAYSAYTAVMREVINLDQKRVCDISADAQVIEICRKGCMTRITANLDGTLNITQERIQPVT